MIQSCNMQTCNLQPVPCEPRAHVVTPLVIYKRHIVHHFSKVWSKKILVNPVFATYCAPSCIVPKVVHNYSKYL